MDYQHHLDILYKRKEVSFNKNVFCSKSHLEKFISNILKYKEKYIQFSFLRSLLYLSSQYTLQFHLPLPSGLFNLDISSYVNISNFSWKSEPHSRLVLIQNAIILGDS